MSTRVKDLAERNGNEPAEAPEVSPAVAPPARERATRIPRASGNEADVTVRYKAPASEITGQPNPNAPRVTVPLGGQAPQTQTGRIISLARWLAFWKGTEDVESFQMIITRKSDPPRLPNQPPPFRRPVQSPEELGQWSFPVDYNEFVNSLQAANNGSGGLFHVLLIDHEGELIAESNLWPEEFVVNGEWHGRITDPVQTEPEKKAEAEQREKPPTISDAIDELVKQKKRLQELGMVPKDTEGTSSLADEIRAAAVPSMVGALISATTEGIKAAAANANAPEESDGIGKMIVKNVFSDERMKEQIFTLARDTVGTVGDIASGLFRRRGTAAPPPNDAPPANASPAAPPQVTPGATDPPAQQPPPPQDIVDYILAACEAQQLIDVPRDNAMRAFKEKDPVVFALITGKLRRNTAREVLHLFVTHCEKDGRGERAREIASLPWAVAFVEHMQDSVKKG